MAKIYIVKHSAKKALDNHLEKLKKRGGEYEINGLQISYSFPNQAVKSKHVYSSKDEFDKKNPYVLVFFDPQYKVPTIEKSFTNKKAALNYSQGATGNHQVMTRKQYEALISKQSK